MSITDELRAWAKEHLSRSSILAIADRIDVEHEESIQREHESAYDAGYADGMGVANKADMRAEYLRGKNDGYDEGWDAAAKTMTEHMVELPKDADGEVIHIGDEMARGRSRGRVIALMLSNYPKKWGGALHWGIQLEGEQAPTALDGFFHHYHAPTVEDVLREFSVRVLNSGHQWGLDGTEVIAEYAAKLQLKEEA